MDGGGRPVFVGLLGPVELGAGREVRRPALRVLLAVLALSANRVVTADALIGALPYLSGCRETPGCPWVHRVGRDRRTVS
jgi:hypothetical protein